MSSSTGAFTRYAIEGLPSRPDAADLLVVAVDGLGQAGVHHGAHVGHVDPEAEGRRADHDVVPGRDLFAGGPLAAPSFQGFLPFPVVGVALDHADPPQSRRPQSVGPRGDIRLRARVQHKRARQPGHRGGDGLIARVLVLGSGPGNNWAPGG